MTEIEKLEEELAGLKGVEGKSALLVQLGTLLIYTDGARAEVVFSEAMELLHPSGQSTELINVMHRRGLNHKMMGDFSQSMQYFLEALNMSEQMGDKPNQALVLYAMADIQSMSGHPENALDDCVRAKEIHKELGNEEGEFLCTLGMLIPLITLKKYEELFALSDNLKSLLSNITSIAENKKADFRGFIEMIRGTAYMEKNELDLALKYYMESLGHFESYGDFRVPMVKMNIAHVYCNQGRYSEAIAQLSFETDDQDQNPHSSAQRFQILSESYERLNDLENALKYYKLFKEKSEEQQKGEVTRQLAAASFKKEIKAERDLKEEVQREKKRADELLYNILPEEVAEELKAKGSAAAKYFDNVTGTFTDFKGFTTISEKLSPQQLVDELHACFSGFDAIMNKYNIEKIKTVGDAYLAVCGLPLANTNHAQDIVNAAIEIKEFMQQRRKEHGNKTFEIRIGIHSGSVVAGIVGVKKFSYDIWGDTVNTAARMEQNSEGGKINISQTTYELVKDKFNCEYRGEIEAKNKGKLKMYFVS